MIGSTSFLAVVLPAASLLGGVMESNLMGKCVVMVQVASSILAVALIIGKNRELNALGRNGRKFLREFLSRPDVLDYYLLRKKGGADPLERIYTRTCDRMVKLLDPEMRRSVLGRQSAAENAALSQREIELVRNTCERTLQDETIRVERGISTLATIVATAPMIGLLGTVWGVLDAFAIMGGKGAVLLAEIAPAISAALVTTVLALLVAIPSAICYNYLIDKLRQLNADMDGFADELMGRIVCEFQGGGV